MHRLTKPMLARCLSASLLGFDAIPVTVEVDLAPGLPGLQLVGLPDAAIQESRERVRAALRNSGFRGPLVRVVVNLAPADLRKEGPCFDLPIALALLVASGQLDAPVLRGLWCAGELGLDGSIRPCRGILAIACRAAEQKARALVVAADDAAEAGLVDDLTVVSATTLHDLVESLKAGGELSANRLAKASTLATPSTPITTSPNTSAPNTSAPNTAPASAPIAKLPGQRLARQGLALAAAGGHHLLLVGPPGCGKTQLAHQLPALLPPLEKQESLEITRLHSIAGLTRGHGQLIRTRPFRSPHHTSTSAALLGGGAYPRPGELSLAHGGVLFLDEMAEFPRSLLDQLRQPLEEGVIWLSRSRQRCRFPSRVTLVAATNPCPCGWAGDPRCTCSELKRKRYWSRLSGPLLDRLDLQLKMDVPAADNLRRCFSQEETDLEPCLDAATIQQARQRMMERNPDQGTNRDLDAKALYECGQFSPDTIDRWDAVIQARRLSLRSGLRLLRVARSVADLRASATVEVADLASALCFRSFDLEQS